MTWGHEVSVGYFSQDHRQSIRAGVTLIEWLHEFDPMASQAELRGVLGQMLFSGDDAVKRTEALSGGEAARLTFCRLMLEKPNVLLLDEPTNHLDLESIQADGDLTLELLGVGILAGLGKILLFSHRRLQHVFSSPAVARRAEIKRITESASR